MSGNNKELDEVLKILEGKGITTAELFKYEINDKTTRFKELTRWTDKNIEDYNKKLSYSLDIHRRIKRGNRKDLDLTTKQIGDLLEDLVKFIINKTYFFGVIDNVKTKTNEIDQFIKLTQRGKSAIENGDIPRDCLIIKDDYFLGECKNYDSSIGVTWVGKFYGLLKSCDCNFGIIFSFEELTGEFDKWRDAEGLIRTFSLIEKHKYNSDFYILHFGLDDFKRIGSGESFFDIINAKIDAIRIGANYSSLVEKYKKSVDDDKKAFISRVIDCKEE